MKEDLYIKVGDDNKLSWQFTDDQGGIDISGSTAQFAIKKRRKDTDAEAVYLASWTIHTNPNNGDTEHIIPKAASSLIQPSEYVWQLRLIESDGLVSSSDVGRCLAKENVIDHA